MIGSMLWVLSLLALYLAGEMLTDWLLPHLTRPMQRWLRTQRSPWFLAALWLFAVLAMVVAWHMGSAGAHHGFAAALFVGAGAAAVAGTMNWLRVANGLPENHEIQN